MTNDGTVLSDGVSNLILETVKSVRVNLKRGDNLTTSDIAYLAIDPVLEALGWNLRDPREVRREGGDTILLMMGGTVTATIKVLEVGKPLAEKAGKFSKADGDWIITTNGLDWNIYYSKHLNKPIRQALLEGAVSARNSVEALSIIELSGIKITDAADIWAMSINADVTRALESHLNISDALVAAVTSQLGADSGADANDVRTALSRLSVAVSQKPLDDTEISKKPTQAKKPKSAAKIKAKKVATAAKKPVVTKSKAKAVSAEITWPDTSTHIMRRKGTTAFIRHDKKTGISHLIAGSVLSADIGKSLAPSLVKMREDAKFEGNIVDENGSPKVVTSIPLNGPRIAASFVAGAQVRDLSVWQTKNGKDLTLPEEGKAKAAKSPAQVELKNTDRKSGTLGLSMNSEIPETNQETPALS
jgi:hypothetical protein